MRVELTVLGPVRAILPDHGTGAEPLTQPRPLALLSYLVLARPQGPRSRDELVALLWPQADHATGRQALRNALHRIRTALGADLLVASGESQVGADHARIRCDAIEFQRAVDEKRWKDALSLYRGELLQGFHVGGAPAFERWLDSERERLRSAAVSAAWSVASAARDAGDISSALSAAHAACGFAPYDERSLRQLLELMAADGDRAGALRTYEDFSKRLSAELDAQPSAATQATIRTIRTDGGAVSIPVPVLSAAPSVAPVPTVGPDPAPATGSLGRKQRRWVGVAIGLAALAGLGLARWPSTARAPAVQRVALDPAAGVLAPRWHADTAHLAAYLRARARLETTDVPGARVAFQALVREAPLYAPGWAGLSVALYKSGFADVPPRQAMLQAEAAASRALALDPNLPDAIETLIAYDMFFRWDLAGAGERLDSALARYPGYGELLNLRATWHRFRGELDISLDLKELNAQQNPLSPIYAYQIASSLYLAHRCEEAESVYRRLPVEIRAVRGNVHLYRSLACQGKEDEAAAALRDAQLQSGDTAGARLLAPPLTSEQRARAVEAIFRKRLELELEKRRLAWTPPEEVMLLYAELQNADSTLMWLDSMYVERSMMLYIVPFDPLNDFLRDDPRFQAFLERLPWLRE
jgi:DNA-binding SARP family transcriptional activator